MKFTITPLALFMAVASAMSGSADAGGLRNLNQLAGGDADEYGCRASAGEKYCDTLDECVRDWETSCPSNTVAGGDSDEHGCKGSAGEYWCETLNECIRSFETTCPSSSPGPQCGRQCGSTYDCANDGGVWDQGHAWCGSQCTNGRCHPRYEDCTADSDCDPDKAVCGNQGFCVGK